MQTIPHILYAEDDPDTRELVQFILRQAGFRVSVTGDSSEVLDLLATDPFDALLLDNWMPKNKRNRTLPIDPISRSKTSDFLLLWSSHGRRQKGRVCRWCSRLFWKTF